MQTGDGLLVRLRITGGIIPARLARDLTDAARRFGNGLFDLSARSNLQMRGLTEGSLPALTDRLRALGLLDDDPAAESVRNVLASPLAGRDPTALLDIRPVIHALERGLVEDAALHALPGKFGFLVDDAGLPSLAGVSADVRFEAFRTSDGVAFAVQAGGDARSARPVTTCRPEEVTDVARALALAFLAYRNNGPSPARRMAALADRLGAQALAAAAGLTWRDPFRQSDRPLPVTPLGSWTSGKLPVFGVGAPFGRWRAEDLADLADIAERDGLGELRLTPFRAILLPGVSPDVAARLTRELADGFIVSADDPRLAVAACPGAPACANGTTPTHEDALALAEVARGLSPSGVTVHVSGCAKGCARQEKTAVTLVGRDGRYDLVLSGTAADAPTRTGLGRAEMQAVLRGLANDRQGIPA
jgi:precorrin-3B synthase